MRETARQIEATALDWLARRHSGCWDARDEAGLAAWLAADPAHAAAWRKAQYQWERFEGLRPLAARELHAARIRPQPVVRSWHAGIALAGLCTLIVGVLVIKLPGSVSSPQTYQTARGERTTVTLPDGSSVELNTASTLDVGYGLTCRCLRLLNGEAVFHAAHGDWRGFKVEVGGGRVRDIGTEFWIRTERDASAVAVLEGAVEVRPAAAAAAVVLRAGDRIAYAQDGRRLSDSTDRLDDLTAWRTGMIVFRDAPVPEVLKEFARYHAVTMEVDARLAAYHLSGRFASQDLDGLVRLLTTAYPIKARHADEVLRLELQRS